VESLAWKNCYLRERSRGRGNNNNNNNRREDKDKVTTTIVSNGEVVIVYEDYFVNLTSQEYKWVIDFATSFHVTLHSNYFTCPIPLEILGM